MIKNIIVADRCTGKTRHLIQKCSQDEYSLIVCPTRAMCKYTFKEAESMGVKIPMPITFEDFVKGRFYSSNVNKFYFDELGMSLSSMANGVQIDTAIIGMETGSKLYAIGPSVNRKENLND